MMTERMLMIAAAAMACATGCAKEDYRDSHREFPVARPCRFRHWAR